MRGSTYPPALRTYLKLVPAASIYLYLTILHPWMLYSMLYNSKERIDRLFFKRNGFQKRAGRRDDLLRWYYKPEIEKQPLDMRRNMAKLFISN